jgi:transglutaminase-like putative cysteine protease
MEAFSELRMRPGDSLRQKVYQPSTRVQPSVPIDSYIDYFGNYVETISIPFRHTRLVLTSICDVVTQSFGDALSGLDLTLEESIQLFKSNARELHDFLKPSPLIPFTRPLRELARKLLPKNDCFATAVKRLNHYIFSNFKYTPGATDVGTTVNEFLETKKGVCQDFAHLMICLFRAARIPARYVSGYIETEPPPEPTAAPRQSSRSRLIGATASHAWVQIYTPNQFWIGLDPTNNILEGDHHVQIALGRDYSDVPPLKGVFKGAQRQKLAVKVNVTRHDLAPSDQSQSNPTDSP